MDECTLNSIKITVNVITNKINKNLKKCITVLIKNNQYLYSLIVF